MQTGAAPQEQSEQQTLAVRGRDRFARMRPAIRLLSGLMRMLPVSLNVFIWNRVEGWHGMIGIGLRYCLLKCLAHSCGENVLVGPNVEIRHWRNLIVGANVSIHRGCYIDAAGAVTISSDVSIAHSTSILSFEHGWQDHSLPIRDNPVCLAPVFIEPDVWIGCGCRILSGVRVHSRSIVAAGAVVTKDVPPGSLVGGVPARVLKSIR